LEEHIRERTEAYDKVVEKTKRMQLEFVGSEITHNKVFTDKPRKDVLAAITRKVARDQLIAQVGSPRLPPIGDRRHTQSPA
jgi:hypothetical protein